MGVSVYIQGFTQPDNDEFKKHLEVLQFCYDKGVSCPKETTEYFKGKIDGDDLEDYDYDYALERLENGLSVDIDDAVDGDVMYDDGATIDLRKLPKGVDIIKVSCG